MTVIPVDREVALSGYTVLVDGDRIVQIGEADEVEVPAEAERIDGGGRHLIPGLADMHTHSGVDTALRLYPIHGVTMIRINADSGDNPSLRDAPARSS